MAAVRRDTTDADSGAGPNDVASVRRVPAQARSRARLSAVLDATAELIDDIGPDAVTTALIAERAEVSVGWLYDFFPNKEAVFEALMARSISQVTPIVERVHREQDGEHWPVVLGAVIDALFDFYRTDPGFRVLWFSRFQSAQMIAANVNHDLADARAALQRLEHAGLHLSGVDPEIAMHLIIGIIDKGLDLAFRIDQAGDRSIVDETKVAVCRYLERYVAPTGRPRRATHRRRP
jgi:AcrR family transcriptional regulator